MNDSANTLSMQMMLNQTMLTRTLAEEVDKCPPNGSYYCHTKCSLHRVHYRLSIDVLYSRSLRLLNKVNLHSNNTTVSNN